MTKREFVVAPLLLLLATAASARPLDIYFIDVEGGQATLIVTPSGESLLIDAGYAGRGGRDADRILTAARDAHVDRIDYLLITHFHNDHVGGVPDLAARIPIGTFIDYGKPLGTSYGPDRMTVRAFQAYEPVRAGAAHLQPEPGDRLPLKDVEATVVSTGARLISTPLPGAGEMNPACSTLEPQPEDGTENYRSLGIMLRFGDFNFLDLGDLSGDTLADLVCPRDLIGEVSAYLIPHHGNYDTNILAVYAAIRPRVTIMNNGAVKGGDPAAFSTLARLGLDVWQLHESQNEGAANSRSDLVANPDDEGSDGFFLKLSADADGSFSIANRRTGYVKIYQRSPGDAGH